LLDQRASPLKIQMRSLPGRPHLSSLFACEQAAQVSQALLLAVPEQPLVLSKASHYSHIAQVLIVSVRVSDDGHALAAGVELYAVVRGAAGVGGREAQ
jgi:hypothetical protein